MCRGWKNIFCMLNDREKITVTGYTFQREITNTDDEWPPSLSAILKTVKTDILNYLEKNKK